MAGTKPAMTGMYCRTREGGNPYALDD